jgi:peroxiredoxin-like protein
MENKFNYQLTFETNLNWLSEDRGIVYAKGCNGTIHVSTAPEFGGSAHEWSPEHLLLSAITSCYLVTFMGFSKKAKLATDHLECKAIGHVQIVDGKYKFTQVDVYPKIFLDGPLQLEAANSVAQKTQHYCLISNSINADITYHTEIFNDQRNAKSSNLAGMY